MERPLYRTVLCHLLIVAIALQSLLAFVVAHPLHEQDPHHHEVPLASNLSEPEGDLSLTDHLHMQHCCHFHLGCGVFAAGNLLTIDLGRSSIFWSDIQLLIPSTHTGSLFRPPIV